MQLSLGRGPSRALLVVLATCAALAAEPAAEAQPAGPAPPTAEPAPPRVRGRYADDPRFDPAYADPELAVTAEPWPAVELAPELDPGRYLHDGWYARLALGQGFLAANVAPPDAAGHAARGAAVCAEASAARSLNRPVGLALGIGAAACLAPAPRTSLSLRPGDELMYLVTLGMIADGFPDPRGGFHLGGELGFALASTGETGSSGAVGPEVGFFLGWDAFVAPDWSIGALVRGSLAAAFEGSDAGDAAEDRPATVVRVEALRVLFSVLYQ